VVTRLAIREQNQMALSFAELVRLNFILRFYSLVLPNGAVLALRWQRYRQAADGGVAFAFVIFEKLVLFFVYVVAALLFLLLELPRLGSKGVVTLLAVAGLMLVWTAFLAPFFVRRLAAPTQAFAAWLGRLSPRWLQRPAEKVSDAIVAFHHLHQRRVIDIWMTALVSYALFVLSSFVLEQGMGLGLGLYAMGWIRSVIFILMLLPITVSGFGVREVSYVTFMGFYGVDPTKALAYGLLLFGIQVGLGLIGAVLDLRQGQRQGRAP
jgi:hypothetical protein